MPPDLHGLELIELDLGGAPAYVPRRLPGGKTTWSHSSQALAERCPTQWKRRYLDRVEDPPSAAMLAGGAFGAALEHLYAAALLDQTATPERVAEVAAASFDERAGLDRGAAASSRRARRWWIPRARTRASARP